MSDRQTRLPPSDPASLNLNPLQIEQLYQLIEKHIGEGRYPGAQVAVARNGRLAAFRTFGQARLQPNAAPATDDSLWLMYSQTKVIVTAAVWQLVDRGLLGFDDRIAEHVPEFARHGKGEITLFQLLTHQAGFPSARPPLEVWSDPDRRRQAVSEFSLEWTPGTKVQYHAGSAHAVAAVLIEAVTGRDFREVVRADLLDPLGLRDLFVGVPESEQSRCVEMHAPASGRFVPLREVNTGEYRTAGVPSGGGYGTAADLAAFYQMLLAGGALDGTRVLSPRVIQFATRNYTEERIDLYNNAAMHRGLGPHVRGFSPSIRGLGGIASPSTFGHGGIGSSYSWGDPDSGVSFTYLTNGRCDEPWHTRRLDRLSNVVHAAILG